MTATRVRTDGGRNQESIERSLPKDRPTAGFFIMGQKSSSRETV